MFVWLCVSDHQCKIKKDVFSSCHERGTKKNFWVPNESPFVLRCSTTEPQRLFDERVYYEVLMTRVLHTARISNVDSVMFLTEK